MPRVIVLCLLVCLFPLRAECEEIPLRNRAELLRIEAAYEAGMRQAAGQGDAVACLRLRVLALAELTERTYQSTLAWLGEREHLARALEDDQRLWMLRLAFLSSHGDESLGEMAGLYMDRLRVFGRVTTNPLRGCDAGIPATAVGVQGGFPGAERVP